MQSQGRFELNIRFLARVIEVYGSCAILAWDDDKVVGYVRYFPQSLLEKLGVASLCMQQAPPNGVSKETIEIDFPTLEESQKNALKINCMMVGSQRRGVGSALVKELIRWAREESWPSLEATAFCDLPGIYEITGQAGRSFYEKLGFEVVSQKPNPNISGGFREMLEKQAVEQGLPKEDARAEYSMSFNLT